MINLEVVASLFTVISLSGLIANVLAIYTVFRYKHLHNTFGALCAVQGISNIGILLIFLLWCAFGSYLFDEENMIGNWGKRIGQMSLFFLDVKMYAHLGVSVNRLSSIVFPFSYQSMESNKTGTKLYVGATVLFAFIEIFPLFWSDTYYFVYYKNIAVWGYANTPIADFYAYYIDFLLSVCIFSCILVLDVITVLTLRKFSNYFTVMDHKFNVIWIMDHALYVIYALDTSQLSDSMKRDRKMQIGFFVQSICQMVPSIFAYVSFTFFARLATTDWELFITTTLVWELLHALDGVIMDIFQARKVLVRKKAKTIVVSTTHGSGQTTAWTSNAPEIATEF